MSDIAHNIKIKNLTATSNVVLSNDNNTQQCIFLNFDSDNTNHWKITVDSDGKLVFARYNGTTWIQKFDLT